MLHEKMLTEASCITCSECFAKLLCTCAKQIAQLAKLVGVVVAKIALADSLQDRPSAQVRSEFALSVLTNCVSAVHDVGFQSDQPQGSTHAQNRL